MANSPRVSNNFTLTMLNNNTGQAQQGVGVWTVANQTTNKGQASYQWTVNDMATKGDWWVYTTVKLPAEPSPREFDPELIEILAGTVGAGAAPPGVLPAPAQSLPFLNIRDYGGVGDGVSDNTTAIFNARAAARALGGARILYGPGVFFSGNQDISNDVNVYHEGSGPSATIIKLKNGANTDLFSGQTGSINLAAAFGTGPVGTLFNFGFSNMTLDGNKANQSSGLSYPLRVYGYGFKKRDLVIRNGFSGGALNDWNGGGFITQPSDEMEATFDNIKVHANNGIGFQYGGPHDSRGLNITSFDNGSHNFHIAPNATGMLFTNCHGYFNPNTSGVVDWLVEAPGCQFVNCVAEGSYVCNLALLASSCSWVGGNIYNSPPTSAVGIQLGQRSGQTPFPGQIQQAAGVTTAVVASGGMIQTMISECRGGAISFQNEASNTIEANVYQTVGTALVGPNTPLISGTDNYRIRVNGLTPDGSVGKSGGMQLVTSAFNGFLMFDQAGNNTFDFNANNAILLVGNSGHIQGFSDAFFSTQQFDMSCANGNIWTKGYLKPGNSSALYSGSGVPASGLGANGDFYFRTDTPGTANQRLYVKSAGAWSGIL